MTKSLLLAIAITCIALIIIINQFNAQPAEEQNVITEDAIDNRAKKAAEETSKALESISLKAIEENRKRATEILESMPEKNLEDLIE